MSTSAGRRIAVLIPVAALTVTLALTGCSRLAAGGGDPSTGSGAVAPTTASSAASGASAAAVDPSTLGDISSDLSSAGTADQQADTNAAAADQAAATNDEP